MTIKVIVGAMEGGENVEVKVQTQFFDSQRQEWVDDDEENLKFLKSNELYSIYLFSEKRLIVSEFIKE